MARQTDIRIRNAKLDQEWRLPDGGNLYRGAYSLPAEAPDRGAPLTGSRIVGAV
jgi:hypothetical protein